jgi:hypothetical protein
MEVASRRPSGACNFQVAAAGVVEDFYTPELSQKVPHQNKIQ